MNQRIFELYEKATGKSWSYDFDPEIAEYFAELIVRECILVIEGMVDPEEDSERYVWAIQNASAKVREHLLT